MLAVGRKLDKTEYDIWNTLMSKSYIISYSKGIREYILKQIVLVMPSVRISIIISTYK